MQFNCVENKDIKAFRRIVGRDNLLQARRDMLLYSYDASLETGLPGAVVFPASTEMVRRLVAYCYSRRLPVVARGAGTNLSGGSVPFPGALVICTSRFDRILEISVEDRLAAVEPGVVTQDLNRAAARHGLFFAPDPASMKVSTLGGNIAENAGGPHCLKYGVTTDHVLGLEMVDGRGEVIRRGGRTLARGGGDNLLSLIVGSEGTLGIVTRAWLRLLPKPQTTKTLLVAFDRLVAAGETVSEIISAGIVPATIEMMDQMVVKAVQTKADYGYPTDCEAVLIIEVDGREDETARALAAVLAICKKKEAKQVRPARDETERELLWAGRRGVIGAIASIKPTHLVMDGVVPRTRLPEALVKVLEIGRKHDLIACNLLHAGDGNLHPLLLLDERNPDEVERVKRAGAEIARMCLDLGGTLSGEHGIGLEKKAVMPDLFSAAELELFRELKAVFDPLGILNPDKVI